MRFVNYREDFEFAQHMTLDQLIIGEVYLPAADPQGNASFVKTKFEYRFDTGGMRQFLIENGLIEDKSNEVRNQVVKTGVAAVNP